jgi:hypothetical protein
LSNRATDTKEKHREGRYFGARLQDIPLTRISRTLLSGFVAQRVGRFGERRVGAYLRDPFAGGPTLDPMRNLAGRIEGRIKRCREGRAITVFTTCLRLLRHEQRGSSAACARRRVLLEVCRSPAVYSPPHRLIFIVPGKQSHLLEPRLIGDSFGLHPIEKLPCQYF